MQTLTPPKRHAKAHDIHCTYCDSSAETVALVAPGGGAPLHACPRCLRSVVLRKADLSEPRNERLLEAFAEENGLQVWCTADVAYALPPTTRA